MNPTRTGGSIVWAIAVAAAILQPASAAAQTSPRRPNIIFILADDLGYGELGCYGQTVIQTPQIDKLAQEGIRFTDHYAGSTVCAPSRCCLLLGRHSGHVPVRGNIEVLMGDSDFTVAELLKSAGYATGAVGKWGVGHPPPPGDPSRNGFDFFYGYLDMWHAHNYFPDFLWRNDVKVPVKGNIVKAVRMGGVAIKRTVYSHDLLTAEALKFIEEHREAPFFLYVPFTIPHANNEAGDEGMEVPPNQIYPAVDWPEPQKNHAAMISRLDASVGEIIEHLKKHGLDGDTIVFFSSDNGPHQEGGAKPEFFSSSGILRGFKRDLHEGGIRVPMIARWPGRIKPGTVTSHVSAFWDFLPTAAELAGATQAVPAGIDGISYLPVLLGREDQQKTHEYLYWEFHEGGSTQAVRMGNWKAVAPVGGPLELYNLKDDPAERHNMAAERADIVTRIESYLKTARTDTNLFPLREAGADKTAAN